MSESLRSQTRDSTPEWFEHPPDNAWLLPYDTTLISRRSFAEFSYENHDDNGDFWKIENSLRGGYAIRENLAFGLQMMVPVKWIATVSNSEPPACLGRTINSPPHSALKSPCHLKAWTASWYQD